ncbi:DUF4344 domain-containing metallopeptidase [Antrihabitans sp. YC2-6]|uniref:DUF4344 domain-containing metallopeptidase n=1 Tax=Antrihabitans sp. YC2-6 TaxID=2799498 RepID=UPI0018F38F09|nr:DUF4344 domain-containing metallopeptidase [Antrihabitans sp. YC2-6]MBJ8348676.1 hypothetical protein [Antrihabitans sp. YC2-6]
MSEKRARGASVRRRIAVAAVAAVAALSVVACDSDKSSDKSGKAETSSAESSTTSDGTGIDVDPKFKMKPEYDGASSSDGKAGKKLMEDNQLLQILANNVNKYLTLPKDVPIIGAECGTPNAFWDPEAETITMCYELATLFVELFEDDRDPDPEGAALATTAAVFFHELGHALISLFDLPTLGKEEDVADQLSAVLLLNEKDPELQSYALYYARAFELLGQMEDLSPGSFADEHSLNAQRNFNVLCWVYGSDPEGVGQQITSSELPEERAVRCEDEYQQIEDSWYQLLEPYIKPQR